MNIPEKDKEYDVEFDTDDILKWDDDISLTEVKEPLINMENNELPNFKYTQKLAVIQDFFSSDYR